MVYLTGRGEQMGLLGGEYYEEEEQQQQMQEEHEEEGDQGVADGGGLGDGAGLSNTEASLQ